MIFILMLIFRAKEGEKGRTQFYLWSESCFKQLLWDKQEFLQDA